MMEIVMVVERWATASRMGGGGGAATGETSNRFFS
jgi:hypothetical protein